MNDKRNERKKQRKENQQQQQNKQPYTIGIKSIYLLFFSPYN